MKSVLTRSVFNRLLSNDGYTFKCREVTCALNTCHYVQYPTRRSRSLASPRWPLVPHSQRRTLFGFSRKAPRVARVEDFAPGLQTMLQLNIMTKLGTRPPEGQALVDAWRDYFDYKRSRREPINSLQATHVLRTFRYLNDKGQSEPRLTENDIQTALIHIGMNWHGTNGEPLPPVYVDLVKELYASLADGVKEVDQVNIKSMVFNCLCAFLKTLARARHYDEVLARIEQTTHPGSNVRFTLTMRRKLWHRILRILSESEDEDLMLRVCSMMESQGIPFDSVLHATMTNFYARQDDIENTKLWFAKDIKAVKNNPSANGHKVGEVELISSKPLPYTYSTILQFGIQNNELDWLNAIFRDVLNSNPDKATWDILFKWAAGALGKGVEDVERMIEAMKKYNVSRPEVTPDIETFNQLVELAISKNDAYLAERYLNLAKKLGIYPNARTYILQMDYRMKAGDLVGVQAAYSLLQGQEVDDNEDVPVINRFLRALCAAPNPNHSQITSLAAELDERNVRLESTTTSALCMLHLSREEYEDVMDLLNTHAFHYTQAERAAIIDEFLAHIFNRSNDIPQAWDAYTILRGLFDETDVPTRIRIMNEFFERGRSDMGIHVFGHLRQHTSPEKRPTTKEYVACLEGIAAASDMESLHAVHNMMKLDSSIEPSTILYNALMLAYTSCNQANRALSFWYDITDSQEGPNYRSLEIVFYVCQRKPFGDREAKDIWARMKRMEIEITDSVFSAYVGSLAGQALLEECFDLILNAEKDYGIKPNANLIGSFYNAAPGINRQEAIQQWAKIHYPELWEEVLAFGMSVEEADWMGSRQFFTKKNNRAS